METWIILYFSVNFNTYILYWIFSDDSKPDSKPPSEGEKNQGQGS